MKRERERKIDRETERQREDLDLEERASVRKQRFFSPYVEGSDNAGRVSSDELHLHAEPSEEVPLLGLKPAP